MRMCDKWRRTPVVRGAQPPHPQQQPGCCHELAGFVHLTSLSCFVPTLVNKTLSAFIWHTFVLDVSSRNAHVVQPRVGPFGILIRNRFVRVYVAFLVSI